MEQKRFTKNDNGFICINCGREVSPLGYSSRNHCPFCLHSIHVDIKPGDRQNPCGGVLEPIQALPDPKKGFIIIFKCKKCGERVRCKAAIDNKNSENDDMKLIIKLTANKD